MPDPQDKEAMTHHHFQNQCAHGIVTSQCRCIGHKNVRIVACPATCAAQSQAPHPYNVEAARNKSERGIGAAKAIRVQREESQIPTFRPDPLDDLEAASTELGSALDEIEHLREREKRSDEAFRVIVRKLNVENERLRANVAELEAKISQLDRILDDCFKLLPIVPGSSLCWDGQNLKPHVCAVADEFAILQRQVAALEIERDRLANYIGRMEGDIPLDSEAFEDLPEFDDEPQING